MRTSVRLNSTQELIKIHESCSPCKLLLPTLEQSRETFVKQVSVYSVDTDKKNDLAAHFEMRGLPTAIIFKDGEQVEFLVGRRRYEEYEMVLKVLWVPIGRSPDTVTSKTEVIRE